MTLKGLKKAVGDYQRANAGGYYDARYGKLMYDKSTGELWTDEFYSLGHNDWKEYNDDDIVCISDMMAEVDAMAEEETKITMENVKEFIEKML